MEPAVYDAIAKLARKDGVTMSQKTRDLLLEALELIEDEGLERIALDRKRGRGRSIPLAEAKRRLRLK